MKILYFTPFYPPESEAAAVRSYWFVRTLLGAGHEVKILKGDDLRLKLASNKSGALKRLICENLAGLEVFFRIFFKSRDLVILSSPPFFTVLLGALACILKRQKYIIDVRDLYPEVFFEFGLIQEDSLLGRFAKFWTRHMYMHAHNIVTVTNGLKKEIENYGPHNVHLIMNGYDSEIFFPGTPDEKFAAFTMVFHGNLGKVQSIETLLRLAADMKSRSDIQFIVAGDGPKARLLEEAKASNIKYLGKIPYHEIPPLLRKCHVGLSFRTDDKIGSQSFPVKAFEYVGSGMPVIMSPKGEGGDLLEGEGLAKQFNNDDIEGMAKEIERLRVELPEIKGVQKFSRQESSIRLLELL